MAEAEHAAFSRKRLREEYHAEEEEKEAKRRSCSYRNIISLLESEEEDPAQEDLSSLISSLQQELSSDEKHSPRAPSHPTAPLPLSKQQQQQEAFEEMVTIRRLLHASDDELGIPTAGNEGRFEEEEMVGISKYDGFWEIEDEAANYYTLLQSELFINIPP